VIVHLLVLVAIPAVGAISGIVSGRRSAGISWHETFRRLIHGYDPDADQ
jgi:hypothetical protein